MKTILLLLLLSSSCNDSSNGNSERKSPYVRADESQVLSEYYKIVDDYRIDIGLERLVPSTQIEEVAQEHSENMAKGLVAFGHTNSSKRCQKIMTELGPANLCGEIVAKGQKEPADVFRSWMDSPGHASKIKNSRYTHTGLGVAISEDGTNYWTQIFLEVY